MRRSVYPQQAIAKIRAGVVTVALSALCLAGLVLAGYACQTGGAQ